MVYKYVNTMMEQKAGLYFKSLSDIFTSASGLDSMLSDLNNGHNDLRNQVLSSLCILMNSDDLVGVKLFKLKLLSNILRRFGNQADAQERIKSMLNAFLNNQHRYVLLE